MHRACFFLFAVLVLISRASWADSAAPGTCPGDATVGGFQVTAKSPINGVAYKDINTWLVNQGLRPASPATFVQADTTTPAAQQTSIPLQGIATFIENRARAELEDVVVNHILDTICATGSAESAYFPNTCAVKRDRETSYTAMGSTYDALVLALRSDFQNVGACALYQRDKTYLGYQLMSIYAQNQQGAPLQQLLYGLATSPELGSTEDQRQPFRNSAGPSICTYDAAGFSGPCALVIPFMAYAAALDAQAYVLAPDIPGDSHKLDGNQKPQNITGQERIVAYGLALEHWIGLNPGLCPAGGTTANCPLLKKVDDNLKTLASTADANGVSTSISAGVTQLRMVYSLETKIETDLKNVEKTDGTAPSRTDFAQAILSVGQETMWQLNGALHVGLIDPTATDRLSRSLQVLTAFEGAYAAFEAKEYVIGVDRLDVVLGCIAATKADDSCGLLAVDDSNTPVDLQALASALQSVAGGAAALAEAKSSSDFATTLDELASPVNAWRLRSQQSMLTVQAFGGFKIVGQERYSIPGYNTLSADPWGEVYAPVGIAYSYNRALGGFISLIDVGSMINAPRDEQFSGGTVTGQVQGGLSSVLSPGAFYFAQPFKSLPLVLGAGVSWGPADYRTINYTNPNTKSALASRQRSVFLFVAFDIPVFILDP